jgi:hypothetical protein
MAQLGKIFLFRAYEWLTHFSDWKYLAKERQTGIGIMWHLSIIGRGSWKDIRYLTRGHIAL